MKTFVQPLAVSLNCKHHAGMKAYSVDLGRKVVEAVQRGVSKAQAAQTFEVEINSLKRYISLAQGGESPVPKKVPGKERKLD